MNLKSKISIIAIIFSSCSQGNLNKIYYKLSVDTLNFGTIKFTDTLNTNIYVINMADSNILIKNIENACGCTTALLKDSVLKVNDSVALEIQYIPALVKDSGSIIKFVTLRTNSFPPFINLVIRGKIVN